MRDKVCVAELTFHVIQQENEPLEKEVMKATLINISYDDDKKQETIVFFHGNAMNRILM